MWLERFLSKIANRLPSGSAEAELHQLAEIDPTRISIENVRSMLNASSAAAKLYCDTAVRKGLLKRGYQYWCPDGQSVAATLFEGDPTPAVLECVEATADDYTVQQLPLSALKKTEIYAIR